MRLVKRFSTGLLLVFIGIALVLAACGKKKEAAERKPGGKKASARLDKTLKPEGGIREMIEGAGYRLVSYKKFPSEEPGVKGRVAVYRDDDKAGGVLYIRRTGDFVSEGWHWFFSDLVPDSVSRVEINEDGLWDVEMYFKGGTKKRFIQDDSFTFMAGARKDWLALNGSSSTPVSRDNALWKCFDGDSTTVWRAPLEDEAGAFIELFAPFGVDEGILSVTTADNEQPKQCEIYAGSTKIDDFKLKAKAGKQLVRLSGKIKGAKNVRIVFKSAHGKSRFVSVAELSLK
jgi:hypothetical protein